MLFRSEPRLARLATSGRLAFGTVDSWLLWKLTGGAVHATDPTNASRTLLFGLRSLAWDPVLLKRFGIPARALPLVKPSCGEFGRTRGVAGIPDGVPVTGVAGDQQAALFGQGCVRAGQSKNTYGTGCFLLLHTGGKPVAHLLPGLQAGEPEIGILMDGHRPVAPRRTDHQVERPGRDIGHGLLRIPGGDTRPIRTNPDLQQVHRLILRRIELAV